MEYKSDIIAFKMVYEGNSPKYSLSWDSYDIIILFNVINIPDIDDALSKMQKKDIFCMLISLYLFRGSIVLVFEEKLTAEAHNWNGNVAVKL